MTDMIDTQRPWNIGDDVYGSDESKIGTVKAFNENFLTVEHGFISKKDLYVPTRAVNNVSADGKVYLNVTKDEAENHGWDQPPAVDTPASGRAIPGLEGPPLNQEQEPNQ